MEEPPAIEPALIDNVMGGCPPITRNVKRWRRGSMIVRWIAPALLEASKGFRRSNRYR